DAGPAGPVRRACKGPIGPSGLPGAAVDRHRGTALAASEEPAHRAPVLARPRRSRPLAHDAGGLGALEDGGVDEAQLGALEADPLGLRVQHRTGAIACADETSSVEDDFADVPAVPEQIGHRHLAPAAALALPVARLVVGSGNAVCVELEGDLLRRHARVELA